MSKDAKSVLRDQAEISVFKKNEIYDDPAKFNFNSLNHSTL